MRGCGITPFFCVDKFYIHVDLFYSCLLYTSDAADD